MKSWIIDASVAAKWFFPEELSSEALRLVTSRRRLVAPDLIFAELGNVVWKRLNRGEITAEEGRGVVDDLLKMPLEIVASSLLLRDAFELAAATGRTVYDSIYLALAISRGGVMVTADERLVNALVSSPVAKHVRWLGRKPKK